MSPNLHQVQCPVQLGSKCLLSFLLDTLPRFPFLFSPRYLGEALYIIFNVTYRFVFNSLLYPIDHNTGSSLPSYGSPYFMSLGFPLPYCPICLPLLPSFFSEVTTSRGQIYNNHPHKMRKWEEQPGAVTKPGK